MEKIHLKRFSKKVLEFKRGFKSYLTKLEKNAPKNIDAIVTAKGEEVWKEISCLSCGNCCKKMTPTFTPSDIKRIATYLQMTAKEFKAKWLWQPPKDKDWVNVSLPCQFLNPTNNLCSIYEVRPADCASFPHFTKKNQQKYVYIYKQNLEYCPATFNLVEKIKDLVKVNGK